MISVCNRVRVKRKWCGRGRAYRVGGLGTDAGHDGDQHLGEIGERGHLVHDPTLRTCSLIVNSPGFKGTPRSLS